jgi:iron uptake system component EfeO
LSEREVSDERAQGSTGEEAHPEAGGAGGATGAAPREAPRGVWASSRAALGARTREARRAWDSWGRGRRGWSVAGCAVGVAAVAVVAVAVGGTSGARDRDRASGSTVRIDRDDGLRHTTVSVSAKNCGEGWARPRGGLQVFDLRNTSSSSFEVYLKDAASGAVYGEAEGLGPGATRALRADLGNGRYAFTCFPDDADPSTGKPVRVTGAKGRGGPSVMPISVHDLIPPTLRYQKWIKGQMDPLVQRTDALREAVRGGDLARARTAWLTAHLTYERMGAAYGTFGDADGAINGTTAGLAHGTRDPGFTGFHRVEYGLWHGQSAAELREPADRLAKDVRALRGSWADARMDPLDLGLRAHEIMENTVQFELTGRTDYGSGSNLATARANLDGTRTALSYLRPLLKSRVPQLPGIQARLDRLGDELDGYGHGGRWTPVDRLSRTRREKLNADTGDLVERLADVAAVCDVRRTGQ